MNKEELIQKLGDIEWEDFEVKEAKSDIVSGGTDYHKIEFYFNEPKTVEKTVEKILNAIKNNPKITQKELAEVTGLLQKEALSGT